MQLAYSFPYFDQQNKRVFIIMLFFSSFFWEAVKYIVKFIGY